MIVNSVAERGPVHGHAVFVTFCVRFAPLGDKCMLYLWGQHGQDPMPKPTPPAAPEPVTLFYPVDSEQLAPATSGIIALLFIPFLLLLALIAPAILLYIPLVIINHFVNKTPLDFNPLNFSNSLNSLPHYNNEKH